MRGISASPPSTFLLPSLQSKTAATLLPTNNGGGPASVNSLLSWSKVKPRAGLKLTRKEQPRAGPEVRCNSSTGPGGPTSGSPTFFLGRALAEALSERVESAVGELLSNVGRLQAEQQKQVQEFQEDVIERAKRAKDQAAREALEAQGLVSKPISVEAAKVTESIYVSNGYTVVSADTDPDPNTESDAEPATNNSTLGAPNSD